MLFDLLIKKLRWNSRGLAACKRTPKTGHLLQNFWYVFTDLTPKGLGYIS